MCNVCGLVGAVEMCAEIGRLRAENERLRRPEEIEAEVARWQDRIYKVLLSRLPPGADESRIDGGGCDSGDPLDATEAEVGAALVLWSEENERLREALEAVEWVWCGEFEDDGYLGCPWCFWHKWQGHAPDCARQRALGLAP